MSNGSAQSEGALATYRVVRELGKRSQRAYAAVRGDGSIVVLHRFTRSAADLDGELVSAEQMAIVLRDARCLAKNWHPNIARVRHVELAGDVLHVATELVDGVTLDELLALARARRAHPDEPALSHAILARVFLDVLAGLYALHTLRDGINAPLGALHGELCPANVVVGKDGVARIVNVFRPRPPRIHAESEAVGYAAPETLAGEAAQDARADVHAVGVMLWEALAERRLHDEISPARVAQRQREEDVAAPNARLADVAMRALAFDPALRFRTAQDMAASIRALAGTVASGSAVAQLVTDLAGERIRTRRAELDPRSSGRRRVEREADPAGSGTHARAVATDDDEAPRRTAPSLVTMEAREMRVATPPAPLAETRGEEGPSPSAERDAATPSERPELPAHLLPLPGKAVTSSLPPPDEDDDDLPGPRESTPDDDYLDQLSAEALQGPRSSSRVLDVEGLDEPEAAEVATAPYFPEVESPRAAPESAPVSGPPLDAAPTAPRWAAPLDAAPTAPRWAAPLDAAPSAPRWAAPLDAAPATPRREPSTRTPFVVDLRPSALDASTPDALGRPSGRARRVAIVAAAALFVCVAGAAALLRSSAPVDQATAAEGPAPPDTLVTAPSSPDTRGSAPSSPAEPSAAAESATAEGATGSASAAASASAGAAKGATTTPWPPAPRPTPRKKSVYDPSRYR
ncbi:MAG: protein kinase [Labilithrix sp.]|nr:protein kinase [Labilithrix sp.]